MSYLSNLNNLEIVKRIEDKQLNPGELPPTKRREIVAILGQSYSQAEMASMLQVSDKTIQRDVKAIRDGAAELVKDITVEKVGGEFIRKAEILYTCVIKAKDYKLAWRIETELIDKLQSLGFVSRQPERTESKDEIVLGWSENISKASNRELDAILEGYKGSGEDKETLR